MSISVVHRMKPGILYIWRVIILNRFHRDYLTMQGVIIYPEARIVSRKIETKEAENLVKVNMYERDTL
jgi:hypothetical protein